MIFQLGNFMPNWGCWILKGFKFHRYINFARWSTRKNLYRFSHLTYAIFSGGFFWHSYIVTQFYPIVFCVEPFGTWAIVFWYCLVGEPLLVMKYHKTEFLITAISFDDVKRGGFIKIERWYLRKESLRLKNPWLYIHKCICTCFFLNYFTKTH